ncbi:MAG: hypothetical protein HOP29_07880 [Phycisphaerales bacterium]|nr:hypothetical protein [Phycisphaerales bacterium]
MPAMISFADDRRADVRSSVAAHMNRIRGGHPATSAAADAIRGDAADIVKAAGEFVLDASPSVRHEASKLIASTGLAERDATVRRQSVTLLIQATIDAEPLVWQHACDDLLEFQPTDFDDAAKTAMATMLNGDAPKREIVRLVGVAELRDEMPRLESLLIDESKFETGAQAGRWYGTVGWAARLARARMGSDADLRRAIDLLENESEHVTRVTVLLRDLAYIRRPAAFAHIGKYLDDDAELPPTKTGVPGTPYAQYAIDVLAGTVGEFPVARKYVGAYTNDEIAVGRAWMQRHFPPDGNR